jgi:hypothetical protein
MVQLNTERLKEHFGIGVAFDIITGIIQLLYDGLLLGNAT